MKDIRDVGHRYMIQLGPMDDARHKELSAMIDADYQEPEIKYMGPVYSTRLQEQAKKYIPLSFVFMAVVVFIDIQDSLCSLDHNSRRLLRHP